MGPFVFLFVLVEFLVSSLDSKANKEVRWLSVELSLILLFEMMLLQCWEQGFEWPNQAGFSMAWKNEKYSHLK